MRKGLRICSIAASMIVTASIVLAQRGPAPVEPTPRLADGTPNLGRAAGEKGVWAVPWIRNMALPLFGKRP